MTFALNQVQPSTLQAASPAISDIELGRQECSNPTADLASIILSYGEDPSLNIITILESGAQFLNCSRLNYVETNDRGEQEPSEHEAVKLSIIGSPRELWLYDLRSEPDSENVKIFTALLSQQERRLREIIRLKNLKDYTKKLFESCPDGIVVCDENASIINTNRAMVSMTHRPTESLVGLKVSNLTSKEGRSVAFQALRKLNEQTTSRFDCRLKTGPNRSIPVSICFSDFTFQNQRLILATVRDLSYLEEEAQRCNTYEQSLAQSITNATDGFVRYDQFGRITEVNPYIEKLTGMQSARLVGRPVDDLLSTSSLRAFRKAITQLNEAGYASFGCAVSVSDGRELPAHGTLMQHEVDGERYTRFMLQLRPDSK